MPIVKPTDMLEPFAKLPTENMRLHIIAYDSAGNKVGEWRWGISKVEIDVGEIRFYTGTVTLPSELENAASIAVLIELHIHYNTWRDALALGVFKPDEFPTEGTGTLVVKVRSASSTGGATATTPSGAVAT